MSKFGRGNLQRLSREIELAGTLQKRNRKGLYQMRYFETNGPLLKYWNNEQEKINSTTTNDNNNNNNNDNNGKIFDVRDFRKIDSNGNNFSIQMSHEKFKLEMKALTNEQCQEWVDFLQAKMSLYSIDKLKSSIDTEKVSFETRFFERLISLPVQDQVR